MDLGIKGRRAILCGASKGLGKGCALALAEEGVDLWIVARGEEALAATARELAALGAGKVTAVVADVTTDGGRDAILSACPAPDILITNAAGPPPGDFRQWGQRDWFEAVNANMFSAIDLIRRTLDGMVARRFGRIVNITSFSVKQPVPGLGLSTAARAGLTGFVAALAREHVRDNVTLNNLLPGYFDTDRGRAVIARAAAGTGEDAGEYPRRHLNAGRLGSIEEFGAACAFLCGARAGYISGQNILLDGGEYPGIF
ncbi:MAG: SDR family oxidoreductase [Porticoccaceae bacterium]|nr:SDR family oxidoreductase [Porticoccaceae bacterium]MEA3299483.1 SDR family oxidoreductase [Pseudomonadota bacterium]HLS99784.1 SDR family oxidoreductase [Porticoccaceae bacterium]